VHLLAATQSTGQSRSKTMAIGVLAKLKVIPERQSEFELAFSDYQHTVRTQEKGNLFFSLNKSRDIVGGYVVMEQYVDDEALAAHRDTEHYKAIPVRLGQFLAGPPEITVYDAVE
jgi:quinol monooxygenase YgiN